METVNHTNMESDFMIKTRGVNPKRKKSVSFADDAKTVHYIEQRSELSPEEISQVWYTAVECKGMALKTISRMLSEQSNTSTANASLDASRTRKDDGYKSVRSLSLLHKNENVDTESRGLEHYSSLAKYKESKNVRTKRIQAVLQAQANLRQLGIQHHPVALHMASIENSASSALDAAILGANDQADALEIYRESLFYASPMVI